MVAPAMQVVSRLVDGELLEFDGKTVRLTAHGQLLSNDVFQEFLGLNGDETKTGSPLTLQSLVSR
jgi:coproporphyrinogen III oxidase-like Fe-S oxidoreductase